MPSERARPLVAFAVITVVCGLVIAVNMLRHPTATTTAVVAAHVSDAGSRVEFGTVLAGAPAPPPSPASEVATVSDNVLGVALRRPVVAPSGTSDVGVRRLRVQHTPAAHAHRTGPQRTVPHRTAPHSQALATRPRPAAVSPHRGHGHVRKPSSTRAGHGPSHGHSQGHGRTRDAAASTGAVRAWTAPGRSGEAGGHGRRDHGVPAGHQGGHDHRSGAGGYGRR